MRYLVAMISLAVLSSFTICHKLVQQDGRQWWDVYVYPICGDTGTYLKIETYTSKPSRRKKTTDTAWTIRSSSTSVNERLVIHDTSVFAASYATGEDTVYTETDYVRFGGRQVNEVRSARHPTSREVSLNDSLVMQLAYYPDGTLSACGIKNWKYRGPDAHFEWVEWDAGYTYTWHGYYEDVIALREDTILIDDQGMNGMMIVKHDSGRRAGVWEKRDMQGRLLESHDYK